MNNTTSYLKFRCNTMDLLPTITTHISTKISILTKQIKTKTNKNKKKHKNTKKYFRCCSQNFRIWTITCKNFNFCMDTCTLYTSWYVGQWTALYLAHLGVQSLPHLYPAMWNQDRPIQVHIDHRSSLPWESQVNTGKHRYCHLDIIHAV